MKETLKWQLLLVLIITAIAGYFAYPSDDKMFFKEGEWFEGCKIQLGLDLQGGSELILGFQQQETMSSESLKSGVDSARNIIERRINSFGLKEPRIQPYGNQLLVQLPGVDPSEIDNIKKLLITTGKLEFKLVAKQSVIDVYEKRYPAVPPGYQWYDETPVKDKPVEHLLLEEKTIISGENVVDAGYKVLDPMEGIVVTLKLDLVGSHIFEDVTGKHNEKTSDQRRLAILLDSKVVSAPSIRSKITGGEAVITHGGKGGFPETEARDLSMILRSGSLPGNLEVKSENTLGPSLGADAINRSVTSFTLAIIVVALFMIVYYHLAGMISVLALLINAILLLGILSFFSATLTLPGIAGIVLTMGMAVDSNIIFYERIREEQEKGKTTVQSFEGGFGKALVTVIDANLTTLVAGLVLWYFGTGPIRGFAVTLSAGILTTLFSGYFATKLMVQFVIESGIAKKITMLKILTKPNINFMKISHYFIKFSVVCILLGMVAFYMRGIKTNTAYGVDFTGGTVLNLHFKEKVNIADVRTTIKNITVTDAKTNAPAPKYPDAEVLSVMPPVTDTGAGGIKSMFSKAGQMSEEFQIRTRYVRTEKGVLELKNDLLAKFSDKVAQETITLITSTNKAGYKLMMELNLGKQVGVNELKVKLAELAKRNKKQEPLVIIPEASEEITDTTSAHFEIYFREDEPVQWERALRAKEGLDLPRGVFPVAGMIDTMVSKSLQQNAVIAIILSWICMLIYVAFRFELKYGLAAVVALVHDVLFALGATAAFNLIVPDSWGISVEINFTSVAALMTIIGYSVNDTIVIFDRVRENMTEMKRQPLEAILNASVNQTLGRTIITSLTVFFTVVILFLVTATSGAGIVSFAFPMVIGTIAGSYSTIFIASPFVKAWGGSGEKKPQAEKKD